jgi:Sensors of blue-light using FAD
VAGLRLLLYVSYLAEASGQPDVAAIVRESWKNSERDDVSGLLVFDGSRFAQFLEGPEAAMQHRAAASKATIDTAISRSWCGQRAWIADGSRRGVWVI